MKKTTLIENPEDFERIDIITEELDEDTQEALSLEEDTAYIEEVLETYERPLLDRKVSREHYYNASIDLMPKRISYAQELAHTRLAKAAQDSLEEPENEHNAEVRRIGHLAWLFLIEHHLRLVRKIAKGFEGRGVLLEDLVQEGNLALSKSILNFNPELGFRLSTYVVPSIMQAMKRLIQSQRGDISYPHNLLDELSKVKNTQKALAPYLGYDADAMEVAIAIAMGTEAAVKALNQGIDLHGFEGALEYNNYTPTHIQDLLDMIKPVMRLDVTLSKESDTPFSETLLQPEDERLDDFELEQLRESLTRQLGHLSKRSALILDLRYGLSNDEPMTHAEIGERLNLSRERVRQLEKAALDELAEASDSAELLAFTY